MKISPRCILLAAVFLGSASAARARIELQVSHVGFPSVAQGDIVRAGSWTPIYVDISLINQAAFDGSVRASQLDTDGDDAFDKVDVHLRAESGGHVRVVLYVVSNPGQGDNRYTVELRDSDGALVQVVSDGVPTMRARPTEPPFVVGPDDLIVLSVADASIGRVKDLAGVQRRALRQAVHVGHIAPADLPEHWIGLDAVDYVVWDDAVPEKLTARQLSALLEWTQQGGTLLIAASHTAPGFSLIKPLSAAMPADVSELASVNDLPITRAALLEAPVAEARTTPVDWLKDPFPNAAPLALAKARPFASVVVREPIRMSDGRTITTDLITRAVVGSGHIIFCGIRLRDLFSAPGDTNPFFEKIFHLIPASSLTTTLTEVSLFGNVTSAVGFVRSRSAYLVLTFLFALAYVVLATWGSWTFLSRRGWRQHSWTAFAVLAVLAGIGAGVAVGAARGITDRLQQVAIIDTAAGDTFGRGTAFFGLKSGIDKTLDLWLPPDWLMAREPEASSCFLRPLPAGLNLHQAERFADPVEYALRPASGEIHGARFRATLKRFEGRWDGPLGGNLQARIAVQGRDRLLTEDSYITNNLGVELTNAFLVHTWLDPGAQAAERSRATYAYAIEGAIPSDGSRVQLYERCFQPARNEKPTDVLNRCVLDKRHREWGMQFSSLWAGLRGTAGDEAKAVLGKEREALMLLSTIGDFDPGTLQGFGGQSVLISRDRLRRLDLREQLTAGHAAMEARGLDADPRGTMVLIGFARGGGPIRLMARSSADDPYAALNPENDSSWTMYRIRIPFTDLERGK